MGTHIRDMSTAIDALIPELLTCCPNVETIISKHTVEEVICECQSISHVSYFTQLPPNLVSHSEDSWIFFSQNVVSTETTYS